MYLMNPFLLHDDCHKNREEEKDDRVVPSVLRRHAEDTNSEHVTQATKTRLEERDNN